MIENDFPANRLILKEFLNFKYVGYYRTPHDVTSKRI